MVDERRNAPAWLTLVLIVCGVACIAIGIVYFAEPARSLPGFFPGHLARSAHHHTKHGVAAIILGLVVWAVAWMTTGSRSSTTPAGST
ncbi:MAG: hypothetical protein ACJ735_06495 [Actinomycetes bacterium]